MNAHEKNVILQLVGEVRELNGRFAEFSEDVDRQFKEIKESLEKGANSFDQIHSLCASRGVKIENLEDDVKGLKKAVRKVSETKSGASTREKSAIAGSYILQIILEAVRRLWPM
ncbi:MAG: hypothetical protein ACE5OO_03810 [Candidatus Bathyarchaeia archaeon]